MERGRGGGGGGGNERTVDLKSVSVELLSRVIDLEYGCLIFFTSYFFVSEYKQMIL